MCRCLLLLLALMSDIHFFLYHFHWEGVQDITAFSHGNVFHVLSNTPHYALSIYHGIRCYTQSIRTKIRNWPRQSIFVLI